MNLARSHVRTLLFSDQDEAGGMVDPPFPYPGPFRLLKSRVKVKNYLANLPTDWDGTMDMQIAMLDTLRHHPGCIEIRKGIGGSFMYSYTITDNAEHLRKGIVLLRGVYLSRFSQESRRVAYEDISAALGLQFADFSKQEDLEELIQYTQEVYESAPEGPDREYLGKQLYQLLLENYTKSLHFPSLELALDLMPEEDPKLEPTLDLFVRLCYANYKQDGNPLDLSRAIEGRKRWLKLEGSNDLVKRGLQLNTLVMYLFEMSDGSPGSIQMTLGIDSCREALELEGQSNAVRLQANIFLARLLYLRFKAHGHYEDVKDAVETAEEILAITDPTSPQYLTRMDPLIPMLMDQAEQVTVLEARSVIEKALLWAKRIVDTCPTNHPEYLRYRCNYGNIYHWCYLYGLPDVKDHLHKSFEILEAVERDSRESTFRADILSTYSNTLSSLYEIDGDAQYLEKSLDMQRKSLLLRKDDPIIYLHLGGSLRLKYRENPDRKVLEEAIKMLSQTIDLSDRFPGIKKNALRELCGIYHTLFSLNHLPHDIQMAIEYGRDGLTLPSNTRDSGKLLDSLSNAYNARFDFEGDMSDLDQSIYLLLLATKDLANPLTPTYLISLADRLRLRCFNLGNPNDLEDAIKHCQTALNLLSSTSAEYKYALSEMSYIQHELFKINPEDDIIRNGIKFAEEALPLHQSNDDNKGVLLDHIGSMYYSRYEKSKAEKDLLESARFGDLALAAISTNSPKYPTILNHSSFTLREHMQKFGSIEHKERIRTQLSTAIALPTIRPFSKVRSHRLLASLSIQDEDWAGAFEHLSAAIELYPKISPRVFTADEQQRTVRDLYGLAQLAASCALSSNKDCGKALEVLEAGRGNIAGWLINSRNDISRLKDHDEDLATRYTFLRAVVSAGAREMEAGLYTTTDKPSSLTQQDQLRDYYYELEEIEESVRSKYSDLRSFQRPLSVDDMKKLATKVPIVEINSTVLRSDAFIVTDTDVITINLPRETYKRMEDVRDILFGPGRLIRSLPAARGRTNEALRTNLKWLYENVVSDIMAQLKIKPSSSLPTQRLIWVSNGLTSFCPLHAAQTFSSNRDESTAAHVVSSYTPSLKALQFAREKSFTLKLEGNKEILVIAMPQTKNSKDISATQEAANLAVSFEKYPANSLNLLESPSRKDVLEGLKTASLAHFACHGYASGTDPSQSCLLLADSVEPGKPDRLSVRDLTTATSNLARLCYLSACSTAENTAERLTDENLHMASAFQLSGYSHVVGTLWEAGDQAALLVAKVFYDELAKGMFENGDGGNGDNVVAFALHRAVNVLREKKQPGSRLNPVMDVLAWAPFIHLGP